MGIPAFPFCGLEISALAPYLKQLDNPQVIGEHLKKRRIQLKITQKSVAEKIGVSEDCITYWENNRSQPQINHYPRIIQFLGYNPFPIDETTLGGKIRKYRIENGLSHKKLGKKMKVDASTIGAWEQNQHLPNSAKQKELQQLFNQKNSFKNI